jgi:catechol 2,3-dioxygenase-like lactoylglutathione lyase family enzyme
MKLGAFSISLNVKDLNVSKEFYEKLGFKIFGGSVEANYLIMKSGSTLIGLFQNMFEGNILTFNPGWNQDAELVENFDDIRKLQADLKSRDIQLDEEIESKGKGAASFTLTDPDGNKILVDQHV